MAGIEEKRVVIGTHDGKFHADEILGCFLLKQLPEYKKASIMRTRDLTQLEACDIVIDVGGVYDHSKRRYDHHQKSFNDTFKTVTGMNETIKLSSAGLVWCHYGKEVIAEMTGSKLSLEDANRLFFYLYKTFVREIDAKDNGIEIAEPPLRYHILTDISSRISRLNPNPLMPDLEEVVQFMKAIELIGSEFTQVLQRAIHVWLPSRNLLIQAVEDRYSVDYRGHIIKLNQPGVNWSTHLKDLESETVVYPTILFVLFPDTSNGWRVQAVSKNGGFTLRKQVLKYSLALRDEELVKSCGIPDVLFVHSTGFIGGARSYEAALKMAQKSIKD